MALVAAIEIFRKWVWTHMADIKKIAVTLIIAAAVIIAVFMMARSLNAAGIDKQLSGYTGDNLTIVKNCEAYIGNSRFSARDTIAYTIFQKTSIGNVNGKVEWVFNDKYQKVESNDYAVVIGDIHSNGHCYATLLIDGDDYRVKGYEPIK